MNRLRRVFSAEYAASGGSGELRAGPTPRHALVVDADEDVSLIELRDADDGIGELAGVAQFGADADDFQVEIEAAIDQHARRGVAGEAARPRGHRVLDLINMGERGSDA